MKKIKLESFYYIQSLKRTLSKVLDKKMRFQLLFENLSVRYNGNILK